MSETKEKNKELYAELKSLDDQIKKLNAHLENVDEQLTELNSSKMVVDKFSELKKGDELKVPLASGIYIKATLDDTKKLMINVGAGVTVEKTPKEVEEILGSQLKELTEYRDNLVTEMKKLIDKVEVIQSKVE